MTRDELAAELLLNLGSQREIAFMMSIYDRVQANREAGLRVQSERVALQAQCPHPLGGDPCPVCGSEARKEPREGVWDDGGHLPR